MQCIGFTARRWKIRNILADNATKICKPNLTNAVDISVVVEIKTTEIGGYSLQEKWKIDFLNKNNISPYILSYLR